MEGTVSFVRERQTSEHQKEGEGKSVLTREACRSRGRRWRCLDVIVADARCKRWQDKATGRRAGAWGTCLSGPWGEGRRGMAGIGLRARRGIAGSREELGGLGAR